VQLGAKSRLAAILIAHAGVAEVSAVPAIAEGCADDVFALGEQRSDVIGAVVDALVVIGPAGDEMIVAEAFAVEMGIADAKSRDIHGGGSYGLIDVEARAQKFRGRKNGCLGFQLAIGRVAIGSLHFGWMVCTIFLH